MGILALRPAEECRWDALALGEVMLRLDPGDGRVRTARHFRASEGGGEYNVVRGLRRVFGLRTAMVTALVDNEIGRLIEDLMLGGGVDTSLVQWQPFDGVGRRARNGLNFTERGFGVRGAVGVSDRGHTAVSQLSPQDVDWEHLFGHEGVRWLHTGGIFAALSDSAAATTLAAVEAAGRHGTVVSYDLNYRPSLWQDAGGQSQAREVNRTIAPYVDVMLGNVGDFTADFNPTVTGVPEDHTRLDIDEYASMMDHVSREYPNLSVLATTVRAVRSASVNDWGALAWSAQTGVLQATQRDGLEVYDRVGGGDSFASGLIYGLMVEGELKLALEYAAAHGALVMTTPGDASMASLDDVRRLAGGGSARTER